MPLTTTAQVLSNILTPKLQSLAGEGGGSKYCRLLSNAIAASITEWLATCGSDAVTVVSSMVATSGSPSAQTGTVTTFVGKII